MIAETPDTFEMQGRFAGFFRDIFGKRRMVLKVEGEEVYLKVPKPLREELTGQLIPGQEVRVFGDRVSDERKRSRLVVAQVQVASQSACISCPIQVCAKKNCWRNGGQDVFRELERRIDAAGLTGTVKLKAVGCLDHCDHGPNVEAAGREYHRCSRGSVDEILAEYAEQAGRAVREKLSSTVPEPMC